MATIAQYATYSRSFLMVDDSDHLTGKTGLTITLTISKAGGAFAAPAGSVAEISNGWYSVALTNADTNTAGDLSYHATGSGADVTDFTDQVITQAQLDAQVVGATANYSPTRNELITTSYRKAGLIGSGETLSGIQLAEGITALSLLIRQMDGEGQQIWGYGTAPSTITLQENIGVYTSAEGLPTNIIELTKVTQRTGNGLDNPVDVGSHKAYEDILDKFSTGEPEFVYLNRQRNPASQSLYVWPLPSDVGTQSEVTGTDALNYSCIRSHTSDSTNQPVTGANWRLYWEQTGSSGSAWVTDTAYTAPKILRLWYKKPLADFTAANDNPDLPPAMSRYLMLRLTQDIGVDAGRDKEFYKTIKDQYEDAEARIFRKTRKDQVSNTHNKATFH